MDRSCNNNSPSDTVPTVATTREEPDTFESALALVARAHRSEVSRNRELIQRLGDRLRRLHEIALPLAGQQPELAAAARDAHEMATKLSTTTFADANSEPAISGSSTFRWGEGDEELDNNIIEHDYWLPGMPGKSMIVDKARQFYTGCASMSLEDSRARDRDISSSEPLSSATLPAGRIASREKVKGTTRKQPPVQPPLPMEALRTPKVTQPPRPHTPGIQLTLPMDAHQVKAWQAPNDPSPKESKNTVDSLNCIIPTSNSMILSRRGSASWVGAKGKPHPERTLTRDSADSFKQKQSPSSRSMVFPEEDSDPCWKWEHRTGFRSYDVLENMRIEEAFQRGDSKVRLKAGKYGTTPMEIYFVDMIQYDPISRKTRAVQRCGTDNCWSRWQRSINAVLRQIETGHPRKEGFDQYQQRRRLLYTATGPLHHHRSLSDVLHTSAPPRLGYCCAAIVRSSLFLPCSMLGVLLNTVWLGIDAELNSPSTPFYSLPMHVQLIEYFFCGLFTLEISIRFFAFRNKRDCLRDTWFRLDLVLVSMMLFETLVFPPIQLITQGKDDQMSSSPFNVTPIFRWLRLLRLSRLARLLRVVPGLLTLAKGIVQATFSVCVTLLLLLLLMFIFGILFKTQADTLGKTKELFFSTLFESMYTLFFRATLLDSPTAVTDALNEENAVFLYIAFLVYMFISCLTLLNLLVGILCQVASQVSEKEKDAKEKQYLRSNLEELLECYDKDGDRRIGMPEFELLMQNPDVHEVLKKFGVDPGGLLLLKDILWVDENTQLEFVELFNVIMRLRGGNNAHVTDIVELREYVKGRFDRMDQAERVEKRRFSRPPSARKDQSWPPTGGRTSRQESGRQDEEGNM